MIVVAIIRHDTKTGNDLLKFQWIYDGVAYRSIRQRADVLWSISESTGLHAYSSSLKWHLYASRKISIAFYGQYPIATQQSLFYIETY